MATQIRCVAKQYAWGRIGSESLVYKLLQKQNKQDQRTIDEGERYSELWMGTHPSGPSVVDSTGQLLEKYLQCSPYSKLPFLFKVLSIDKPLSIQAHPNKHLASILHKKYPDIYKDDNHKPELACALTSFEALCGFRPLGEIIQLIRDRGCELETILGGSSYINSLEASNDSKEDVLANLFAKLMKLNTEDVERSVKQMITRIDAKETQDEFDKLLQYTNSHFPGDVGVFCVFLLQHVKLQKGESIFLCASLPHCYLSGNIIECMACSDNVVRAGLTPKLKDSETLCSMLDYSQETIPIMNGVSVGSGSYCCVYPVSVDEFLLYRILIDENITEYTIPKECTQQPAILLVIQGNAKQKNSSDDSSIELDEGITEFISPGTELFLSDIQTPFEAYCCTCR